MYIINKIDDDNNKWWIDKWELEIVYLLKYMGNIIRWILNK